MITLKPKPLTPEAFSAYGDVVGINSGHQPLPMNYGMAKQYYDLATIDTRDHEGTTCISLVRSNALSFPFKTKIMEYHPYGSQLFFPLSNNPFLIMVAPPAKVLDCEKIELFISEGKQGVNYHKTVWHHYLMPLEDNSEFVVVDRKADDNNCVETELTTEIIIEL